MSAKQLIEFYSVGVMPMGDVGSVGYSDGPPGAPDTTNFDKRPGYLDSAGLIGTVAGDEADDERDIDADVNVPRADKSTRAEYSGFQERRKRKENFGAAGLPGGTRNDPESPNDYDDTTQARF